MSVDFRIDSDFKAAQKLFGVRGHKRLRRATSRALNETASKTRAEAARKIAAALPLQKKIINRSISVRKARIGSLEALVVSVGRAKIPTIFTKPKPRQGKRGVRYTLDGRRRLIKSAFIQKMPHGHVGVFKRYGKGGKQPRDKDNNWHGLRIQEQTVDGIPSKFTSDEIEKAMDRDNFMSSEEAQGYGLIDNVLTHLPAQE